ncbi:MAG: helix-turn-helix domain-containing protein [Eubacterium sp.]
MGNYKNGLETKESLYRSAKKIFYQKGYEKTTIKDIITDAKTKQGLLNYYFGAKENLAVQIYKDFSNDVVFRRFLPTPRLFVFMKAFQSYRSSPIHWSKCGTTFSAVNSKKQTIEIIIQN